MPMMNEIKKQVVKILNEFPYIKGLNKFRSDYYKNACYAPGHYYSPIVNVEEVKNKENEIWQHPMIDGIAGIDLNTEAQIALINELKKYYADIPFSSFKDANRRYYFENDLYSYTDAIILYSFIRHFKPKRIIEAGSGFTSAVMLDTKNIFFQGHGLELTFIEPYPVRLYSLITENDKINSRIIENAIQSLNVSFFEQLEENDILFIDSTHVSKTGSDVNYVLFEILPRLKSGVFIHFHDVFYPFEYPKEWVYGGFNWNENYLLRAYLMYNEIFEIKLFSDYLHVHHKEVFKEMPLCYLNTGGNLWLQKR